jgi:hypothetical protein
VGVEAMIKRTSVKTKPQLHPGPVSYMLVALKSPTFVVAFIAALTFAVILSTGLSVLAADQEGIPQDLAVDSQQFQFQETGATKEIKEIRFEITAEGKEKVLFVLNGFFPPDTFVLEGERPRTVCDFYDTLLGEGIGRCIEVNGRFIQQIRSGVYGGEKPKVRIVLDLIPNKNYDIEQTFLKKEHLYTLVVMEKGFKP